MNQKVDDEVLPEAAGEGQEMLDLGRLAGSLGFLLRMAQIEIFDAFHAELGAHGLKPGEFSVLWLISCHPFVRQGLISKSLRIKQAHMTKLVRGLEERRYVRRTIPDDDRRSVLLDLTPEGQAFVDGNQKDFFGYFFAKINTLTREETKTLTGLLQKFTGIKSRQADEG